MLTARGWWLLLVVLLLLLCGLLASHALLMVVGLSLLAWFGWEWFLFNLRLNTTVRGLRLERVVEDQRGPVTTLWFGQTFTVRVRLLSPGRLPHVRVTDFVPFNIDIADGACEAAGPVGSAADLAVSYRIHCPVVGMARFEGVRVQVADFQGFFYHAGFVSAPVVYRVLPMLVESDVQTAATKRHNQLLPPGIHRLKRPGSGSELLDLRDYMTGDPPKTIAWKVSARRDKLITKEFESEVPVRCTLFIDTSNSVRVPSSEGKPIHRLIEIAAGVVQANSAIRDLSGLCAFEESGTHFVRPERSGKHLTNVLRVLADAAAHTPVLDRVNPDSLLPLAYSFACDVYPNLMDRGINAVPLWLQIMDAFPRYGRRRTSFRQSFRRWKRPLFNVCFKLIPMVAFVANVLLAAVIGMGWARLNPLTWLGFFGVSVLLPAVAFVCGVLLVAGSTLPLLAGGPSRTLFYYRKRLAAVLSIRYGLAPGGVAALMEDDDQLALHLQRFLGEHQVPYRLPLYDPDGRYVFAAAGKIPVLATALLRAVGKGRDNELFVLLVDLLELDEQLEPLLRAVRVALGRHHQVIVVCPWPPGMRLPRREAAEAVQPTKKATPENYRVFLHRSQTRRFHDAYHRLRRTFARMGVSLVCAGSDEPVALILDRLDRLRALRRTR
jgi:uncharacterized protein (DUF58 family)